MRVLKKLGVIVLACSISLCGCGGTGNTSKTVKKETEKQKTVLVAAAASLQNCYAKELIPMFEKKNPGIKIEGTYDSSGKLQMQIEQGMKSDVFMSAALQQMDALKKEKLVDEKSIVPLLENKLVLIVPKDSTLKMKSFKDVTKAKMIAVGSPDSVPAGAYAKEACTNLGIWDQVKKKASLGTNVTEVLQWVEQGSCQAGIVYATDAAISDKVKVVATATEDMLDTPVIYALGRCVNGKNQSEADKFIKFLCTDQAKKVFVKYGFTINQ